MAKTPFPNQSETRPPNPARPYRLRIAGQNLFVQWLKAVDEWPDEAHDRYAADIRQAVRQTVDDEGWSILTARKTWDAPEYLHYAEKARDDFAREYGLDPAGLGLARYHGGQLVISFAGEENKEYPLYYAGIQIRSGTPIITIP